jgi:hypothetical protein
MIIISIRAVGLGPKTADERRNHLFTWKDPYQ